MPKHMWKDGKEGGKGMTKICPLLKAECIGEKCAWYGWIACREQKK